MIKEISALDLRRRFGEIIEEVRYRKSPYIIKRNGRAMVAIIDIDSFEALKQDLTEEAMIEEYSDGRIRAFFREDNLDTETRSKLEKLLKS